MSKFVFTLPVDTPLEVIGGGNTISIQVVSSNVRYPLVVLKAGIKGDKGDTGTSGAIGGNIFITAPVNLGGNRVVMIDGNYADNTDVATLNKAIGLTKTSALSGAEVELVIVSELTGFSTLTPNEIVYLSTNGTITQVLPVSGYIQQIGVAFSSTKILINISSPINR